MGRAMATSIQSSSVVMITGGASGIGAALAREIARRGAQLVLADRAADTLRDTTAAIVGAGGRAEAHELDVRDGDAFAALVADIVRRHGRIDVLFNNAGTAVGGEAQDFTLDDWRYVVDVCLLGVMHGVHAAYGHMIRQRSGHIVNTASMAGLTPSPMNSVYAAAKHGVVGLSRSLRMEARLYGVRVSVLCPGVIRTPILVNAGRYGRITLDIPRDAQQAMFERLRPMDVDLFARCVLADVDRNRAIIIYPRRWRALWWLDRIARGLSDELGYRGFRWGRARILAAAGKAPDA
jgi:NAD(P)-dependent dehydrogenase (short-subunit alcohol dehydrogenase family)